jgi:Ser/Thr protein kinase RdoA (MazF antagonist)
MSERWWTAVQVIYHIAQRMVEFHAAGYVHRDLKPGNVMWLPRTNRWTVIDFGCAAHQK